MRIIKGFNIKALLLAGCLMLIPVPDAFSVTFKVSPEHIAVDSLYHGSRVSITGEVGADEEVIVKVTSEEHKVDLRKKGKKMGLLWMNVGELEIEPVSDVYLLFSTRDINEILNPEQQNSYVIGYGSLKKIVSLVPVSDEAEKEKWFDEFIKFKENDNIYGVFPGTIDVISSGEEKKFKIDVDWPYQAPPQEYKVSAYTVKNGLISGESNATLIVEKTGALRFLSEMAFNKAAVYGVVSIFIAIFAGFIVSMVFKGGGGGH
ncbi:MAG TPA: hypothetical protein ENH45_01050 [Nitrospirae bacterium]|nr:putative transmembrane protein [bacterium BMS3Abin10]GBE38512.1 putative transmembrane protein [bacterium BMS3Bbin08]HDH50488.1 hypothetical protein [Nitrospirota bacterium]HDZ83781.1 hypothetical protein [Nitrospirota bacterium]